MAIYNVNQNRQFYVVNKVVTTTPADEGEVQIGTVSPLGDGTKPNQVFFKYYGKGGLSRTDLIDLEKVCYVKSTTAEEMRRKLKKITVTLSADVNEGEPIAGQDYTLRVHISNYLAPGDACVLVKTGAVRATKDMNAAQFFTKMKESLESAFSREDKDLLSFEVNKGDDTTSASLIITELDKQPWRLGVLSKEPVNFDAYPTTVTLNGEEVIWGKAEKGDAEGYVNNGTQVADLEYFCMAERGDMFRNMGWPNNIDVKYMVDPSKEYNMLDIHYYFSGDGVQVHKSEKDITFVSTNSDVLDQIKEKFTSV